LRKVDFSAVAGLGYQFENGLNSLDTNNRFDSQNRVIKAGLNYSF